MRREIVEGGQDVPVRLSYAPADHLNIGVLQALAFAPR